MAEKKPISDRKQIPAVVTGAAVAVAIGILLTSDITRGPVLAAWWVLPVLALALLVLCWEHLAARRSRKVRALSPEQWRDRWSRRRAALVMFVAVPALIFLVGGVAILPEHLQLVGIRAVLLLVVCMLPATLWYLFIATRRASLLNEFLANLDRLGLMRGQDGEGDVPRRRRISGYLQRFGAVYGDLPEKVHTTVQQNRFERYTRADFDSSTGMTTTAVPVLTTTALISVGWLLTLPPVDGIAAGTDWAQALTPSLQPVTLAFVGAYFFSVQMLFRRYVLKDLRGSAYVAVSMRVILAIIGVWVLTVVNAEAGLLDEATLFAVSFAIGVFPLVLWQILSHYLKKLTFLTVPSMHTKLPLDLLDGLTVWHKTRLEEEDIENVPNLAGADLVDLLLNTRLAPNRLIDWTDQAILYTALGPPEDDKRVLDKRARLHARGIRNATTFLQVADERRADPDFGALLDDDRDTGVVASLETAVRTNGNLTLILCWRRLCEHARPREEVATVLLPMPVTADLRDS